MVVRLSQILIFVGLQVMASVSYAATIEKIEITGNKRIEKEAIFAKIKSKVGQSLDAGVAREDIRSIYGLGFFEDIQVLKESKGSDKIELIFKVKEKPVVGDIDVIGNTEIKDDEVRDTAGLKSYQVFNAIKLKEATDKIQKLYEDKGYFLAKVEITSELNTETDTVKLVVRVEENEKVKVKAITFIGNAKLSSSFLKAKMITKEGGFFSFISGSGQYKQEAFERDLQVLRFVYYNQGYVQAKIERPTITVTPDKKNIYITVSMDEGAQYAVGEVEFSGDLLFSKEELMKALSITNSKIFAYDALQKDIGELTAKFGDLGYAYANVIPRYRFDDQEKKVDLLFEMDKGQLVYFGKINVIGNSKTRDKVVRRELRVVEGELYHETRRRLSVEGVQRLGFFEEVNFKTSVDPQNQSIMNVDILVKERSTGQIQFGAGYGTTQGFTMTGSVNQTNFLGKGQNLGASLNISRFGNFYSLAFTDPYVFDTRYSAGFDIYQSANTARFDYDENHTGIALRGGKLIGEYTRFFTRYKYDKGDLTSKLDSTGTNLTDQDLFPLATASGVTSSIQASLEFDSRNDRLTPSKGIFASGSFEYAGLGGEIKYTRVNGRFQFFKNVVWDVVWRNSIQLAQISPLDGRPIPFNELYLLGGPYSLRGYRAFTVGRMKFSQRIFDNIIATEPGVSQQSARERANRFFGGVQQALYQTELLFPLVKEAGIMGVVFYDIGSADDTIRSDLLFADVGMGIRWFSPIGPLRFEWGFPLNRIPAYHDPTIFEFSIGTPF